MNEWEWQALEDKTPLTHIEVMGVLVKPGDRVRLRPRKGGDVLDLALAGQTATVESIQEDYEGKIHLCAVLDADPGRDWGFLRQPGHRFFFSPEEIEALPEEHARNEAVAPKILIAGIGNIFQGDDAFGVEVARKLMLHSWPKGVRIIDFGIRGLDLAYALQDGYEATILVDAHAHGGPPGTLYLMEPDLESLNTRSGEEFVDAHGTNPMRALQMAASSFSSSPSSASQKRSLSRILLVGCEPGSLGGEEGHMGLSEPVSAAVDEAVQLLESLIVKILAGEWPVALQT
ncbi:MAG TPA: hydrogenase maturation protease [Candidatus Angelobacter sp.]|nr:hydrogenase maturation protease [Candidatus Angelobacter sp.]